MAQKLGLPGRHLPWQGGDEKDAATARDTEEGNGDAGKGAAHGDATEDKQPTPQTRREGGPKTVPVVWHETYGELPHAPLIAWKPP